MPGLTPPETGEGAPAPIHASVGEMSERYRSEAKRHNYVTPTSFLSILECFERLLQYRKKEVPPLPPSERGLCCVYRCWIRRHLGAPHSERAVRGAPFDPKETHWGCLSARSRGRSCGS